MTSDWFADGHTGSASTNGRRPGTVHGLRRARHALSVLLLHVGLVTASHGAEPTRVRIGDPVPSCEAVRMEANRRIDFSAYRGRVLYVDFWASWCAPCAKSFPHLNQLDARFKARGLTIVGITVDERRTDAERFLTRHTASFQTAHDGKGSCPRAFGVIGMPSSYLIDRQGRIHAIHVGFRESDAAQRTKEIERLIVEAEAAEVTENKR